MSFSDRQTLFFQIVHAQHVPQHVLVDILDEWILLFNVKWAATIRRDIGRLPHLTVIRADDGQLYRITGGGGGGHSHWPVCVMRLSIDHLFCIACTQNAPFFHNFTPNDPYFCCFGQKFSAISSNLRKFCKSQRKISLIIVKIARILCNFTPNDPPFSDLSPNDPLFCKKIVTDSPLIDASVGAPPSFLYVSAPPPGVKCLAQGNKEPAE